MKIEFIPQRICQGHNYSRHFFLLGHKYVRRDDTRGEMLGLPLVCQKNCTRCKSFANLLN